MPDALSKTIPIWCSVVNRAVILRTGNVPAKNFDTRLYTPPSVVSRQEHAQIETRLDAWATNLAQSSYTLPDLCRPLRPLWVTPSTKHLPPLSGTDCEFIPVICLSASKQVPDGVERMDSSFSYIQGSGDDHELWAKGLTPNSFWAHKKTLFQASRVDLEDLVASFVISGSADIAVFQPSPSPILPVKGRLSLSTLANDPDTTHGKVLLRLDPSCPEEVQSGEDEDHMSWETSIRILEGKKGQMWYLQHVLPMSMAFIEQHLLCGNDICVVCPDGKDQSVGVVLCALALYFDDQGYLAVTETHEIDKKAIRTRLEWIIASRPEANPSRTTLKRVNEYLLSRGTFNVQRYGRH